MSDETKTYEATVYYTARDVEHANDLFDDMLGGLGCTDDPDHECPHFSFGAGPYEVADGRRASLRRARRELAYSLRVAVRGV